MDLKHTGQHGSSKTFWVICGEGLVFAMARYQKSSYHCLKQKVLGDNVQRCSIRSPTSEIPTQMFRCAPVTRGCDLAADASLLLRPFLGVFGRFASFRQLVLLACEPRIHCLKQVEAVCVTVGHQCPHTNTKPCIQAISRKVVERLWVLNSLG